VGVDDGVRGERAAPRPWADYGPVFRELWPRLSHLAGDVAEFGVYEGGTALQLAELTGRRVWAFDTFMGTPCRDYDREIDRDLPGSFDPGPNAVRRLLEASPLIVPVVGRFEDTLTHTPEALRIVLAYLDCDLYRSARQALNWLPYYLVSGAVIVVDDYATHPGVRRAIDTFLPGWPERARFDGIDVIEWT
jgi:hypothetical protein